VARIVYQGQYDGVGAAYATATEWVGEHGYRVSGQSWECYLDEPDVREPRTEVFVPCSARSGTKVPD
jgi:effector-binding domain-containing protein